MGKKTKLGKRRKDRFYHLAKETGYRARSAFKIIQLNRKYQFLQQSRVLIDLCAAPGGWLQVAANHMPLSSVIVGVDLVPIKPIRNVVTLQEDITTDKCRQALHRELKTWKADCVLNDGAPNVGSSWIQDAYSQAALTLSALKLGCEFLRQGGWFITKVFRSKDYQALMWVFQQLFAKVHSTKPQASRSESAEIFVVCKGYLAPDKIDPKLLDQKYVFREIEADDTQKTTSFHQIERSKKKSAEGYDPDNPMVYRDVSVGDFVLSEGHMSLLRLARCLQFDESSAVFARHPATTDEVRRCCEDILVLGRRELKLLLNWRRKMREFMKNAGEDSDDTDVNYHGEEKPDDSSKPSDMDVVDKQIELLHNEEQAELKRKKKNLRKKLFKTKEKLALRLQASEDNPGCERDQDLFKLSKITSKQHLSELHEGNMGDVSDQDSSEEAHSDNEMLDSDQSDSILSDDRIQLDNESDNEASINGDGYDDDSDDDNRQLVMTQEAGSNPLVVQFPEEKEATSKARQTSTWFSKDVFEGVENEEDEDFELENMICGLKKKGGIVVSGEDGSCPVHVAETSTARGKDVSTSGGDDLTDPVGSESTDEDTDDSSDYEGIKHTKKHSSGGDEVEVVPVEKKRPRKLDPEGLALGAMLVSSKKVRQEIVDSSYNRWTHSDDNLPDWFTEDEKKHCQKQLPVTKDMVMEYQKKLKEINARPIKKIAEAKARKKAKLLKRLERARQKAQSISDAVDVSEREKAQQLKILYKKAGVTHKKKDVQYVVAKKGSGKRVPRPAGVAGPYKVVDPRMKKDRKKRVKSKKRTKKHR